MIFSSSLFQVHHFWGITWSSHHQAMSVVSMRDLGSRCIEFLFCLRCRMHWRCFFLLLGRYFSWPQLGKLNRRQVLVLLSSSWWHFYRLYYKLDYNGKRWISSHHGHGRLCWDTDHWPLLISLLFDWDPYLRSMPSLWSKLEEFAKWHQKVRERKI